MKSIICITRECNLRCDYCYIGKDKSVMPMETAYKIVDFIFNNTPPTEKVDIGFFGGEPLLEFGLIKRITETIENHPSFDGNRVQLAVVTNGTVFSEEVADFLVEHDMPLCISCDGPAHIQDMHRRFKGGMSSSVAVEKTIVSAAGRMPVTVNAVYGPENFRYLPEVVDYFSSFGVRKIYMNPDFSAGWSIKDAEALPSVYGRVAEQYVDFFLKDDIHYISLVDGKLAVILNGGYMPEDRCKMGKGEFAFTPSGNVYPCERLIGHDDGLHCIGNISAGFTPPASCKSAGSTTRATNPECRSCGIADYCMNWCGCSNFFSSGSYGKVGPFLCASERASVSAAFDVFRRLEEKVGKAFIEKLYGTCSG